MHLQCIRTLTISCLQETLYHVKGKTGASIIHLPLFYLMIIIDFYSHWRTYSSNRTRARRWNKSLDIHPDQMEKWVLPPSIIGWPGDPSILHSAGKGKETLFLSHHHRDRHCWEVLSRCSVIGWDGGDQYIPPWPPPTPSRPTAVRWNSP